MAPINNSGRATQNVPKSATRLRFKIISTAEATRQMIPRRRRVVDDKLESSPLMVCASYFYDNWWAESMSRGVCRAVLS